MLYVQGVSCGSSLQRRPARLGNWITSSAASPQGGATFAHTRRSWHASPLARHHHVTCRRHARAARVGVLLTVAAVEAREQVTQLRRRELFAALEILDGDVAQRPGAGPGDGAGDEIAAEWHRL